MMNSSEHPHPNSALYDALLGCARSAEAASGERTNLLAKGNNPRRLPDYAYYWVDNNGEPLRFKFPALIDLQGRFSRLNPYFNLDRAKSIDINDLRRARAQFELRPLSDDLGPDYPPEAISCSMMALNTIIALCNEVEDDRNRDADEEEQSELTEFWRTYGPSEGNHFTFVVTTNQLFKTLKKPFTPRITRTGISNISEGPLTPSKVKPVTSPLRRTSASSRMTISDMEDPRGLYAGSNMPDTVIVPPNVRDKDGRIVQPADYSTAFDHLTPVSVEVILRLWEIDPGHGEPGSKKDKFGSRIYQIIVEKMEALPQVRDNNTDSESSTPTADKGKRKARDEHTDASPTKKTNTSKEEDLFWGASSSNVMW